MRKAFHSIETPKYTTATKTTCIQISCISAFFTYLNEFTHAGTQGKRYRHKQRGYGYDDRPGVKFHHWHQKQGEQSVEEPIQCVFQRLVNHRRIADRRNEIAESSVHNINGLDKGQQGQHALGVWSKKSPKRNFLRLVLFRYVVDSNGQT